jgi:hypothetical protein
MTASSAIEDFIAASASAGWRVERRYRSQAPVLPVEVTQRYGALPPSYQEFLCEVAFATTADRGIWFLCEGEFHLNDPTAFAWNEIEKMAIETAIQDGDEEWKRAIVSYWDRHVPIMMAPNGDYDYLAIALGEAERGKIVHSYSPYWEQEGSVVADSLDDWLVMLSEALRDPASIHNHARAELALKVMTGR